MREPLILGVTLALATAFGTAGCGFAAEAADGAACAGCGAAGGNETSTGAGGGFGEPQNGPPKAPPGSVQAPRENAVNATPTLPAGDWDDNLNFEPWFQSYRDAYLGERPNDPVIDTQGHVVIRIESESGTPIPDAMVDLVDPTTATTVPLGPTATNGQVLLLATHDGVTLDGDEMVQVTIPNGTPEILAVDSSSDPVWVLEYPGFEPSMPKALELAFLIDTTYSLGDEIEYLRATIFDINSHIATAFPDTEVRWALVAYKDAGEDYVTQTYELTSDFNAFSTTLAGLSASGGGDYPEAFDVGLSDLVDLSWTPPGTGSVARMAFIISDAPAHEADLEAVNIHAEEARQLGIRLYPIGSSGTGDRAELYLRQSAMLTLGRYLFLLDEAEDESDVTPQIPGLPQGSMPCFHMQNLFNLMNRMIASELTGTRVPADETQIMMSVGDPDAQGTCTFEDGTQAQL